MKFFALTVVLAAAASVAAQGNNNKGKNNAAAAQQAKNGGNKQANNAAAAAAANKNNGNANANKNNQNNGAAAAAASAAANKNNGGNNNNQNNQNNNGNNNNNNNNQDIQSSLTLSPDVICTACTDDGQNPPVDQQSASLTSSNNFINFCLGKTLTNGLQNVDGSCNGVPIGDIIPSSNMPSAKIANPPNGGTFPANQALQFKMNIQNLITGNFVNAQTNYFGAPQQVKGNKVVGHTHVTVQLLKSLDDTTVADPEVFAFFKGINQADTNGVLTVDITAGLPAGVYRFCTMNTSANHTPAMVAIAQHGSLDDCIYATAVDGNNNNNNNTNNGNNGNNNQNNNGGNNKNNAGAAASSSSAAAAATSSAAANGNNGKNNGNKNNGNKNNAGAAASSSSAAAAATSSAAAANGNNGKNNGNKNNAGGKANAGGNANAGAKAGKGRARAGRHRRPH